MQKVIIPNNRLSKYQIETAESVLRKALNDKKTTVKEAAIKKDSAKFDTGIKAIHKQAHELFKIALKFKKDVEKKAPDLEVDLDGYNSYIRNLPEILSDVSSILDIKPRDSSHYEPNYIKEEKEIEDFILGLKLGTAIMANLQTLLEKIAKLK